MRFGLEAANCGVIVRLCRNLDLAGNLNGCFLALAHNCGEGIGYAVNFGFCKILGGCPVIYVCGAVVVGVLVFGLIYKVLTCAGFSVVPCVVICGLKNISENLGGCCCRGDECLGSEVNADNLLNKRKNGVEGSLKIFAAEDTNESADNGAYHLVVEYISFKQLMDKVLNAHAILESADLFNENLEGFVFFKYRHKLGNNREQRLVKLPD